MSQVMSYQDTAYARTEYPDGSLTRSANLILACASKKRMTRGRKQSQALVKVPMLDWPSDLFSDNVTMA